MNGICKWQCKILKLYCRRLYMSNLSHNLHLHVSQNYIQGQEPEDDKKSREYFYYIDHQGMLFLDDSRMKNFTSCFKDKKFLKFFFSRIQLNTLDRYREFPFFSPCGKERNYIRCDDLPIVFTHLVDKPDDDKTKHLSYGHAGNELLVPFEPKHVCMMIETGRVYHPAPKKMGGVGLIRSKLAIQLSTLFRFDNGETNPPTHIKWNDEYVELTQDLLNILEKLTDVRKYSLGLYEN